MANFCMKCGSPLKDGALFCPSCGARISDAGQNAEKPAEKTRRKTAAGASRAAKAPKTQDAGEYKQTYRNEQKKPGKKAGSPVLSIILIAVLVIEFAVAGFKYPGFFVKKEQQATQIQTTAQNGSGENTDISEPDLTDPELYERYKDVEVEAVVDRESIPQIHPLSDINISFGDDERSSAPVSEAAVSREAPVAVCGDVTVDLKCWNLEHDTDTLIVRQLPVKTDDEAGYTVTAYDFSLASGQREFNTNVTITIPRTENDYGGCCVTYNEETGKWESLYSEISEDGSSYIIKTNHFSDNGKAAFSDEKARQMGRADTESVQDQQTKDCLAAFYYPMGSADINLRKDMPVMADFGRLWAIVDSNYSMGLDQLVNIINSSPEDPLAYSSGIESLLGNTDGVNTMFTLLGGDKKLATGQEVAREAACALIRSGASNQSVLNAVVSSNKWGLAAGINKAIGPMNALYSLYATPAKIYHEVSQGKSVWDAANNHKLDIIGTAAGVVGALAATGTSIATGAAVIGVGVWIASWAYSKYAPRDLGTLEQIYRDYYIEDNGDARVFYFGITPEDAVSTTSAKIGSLGTLSSLSDEENEQLSYLFRDGLTAFDPRDSEIDSTGQKVYNKAQADWVTLLTFLFKNCEDKPEKLINVLTEFYTKYAEAAWKTGENYFTTFAKWDMDRRGWDSTKFAMPDASVQKEYTDNHVSELMHAQEDLLKSVIEKYDTEAKKNMEEYIRNVELPLLNSTMEFHVKGIEGTAYAVDYRQIAENSTYLNTSSTRPLADYSRLTLPLKFACSMDGQIYSIDGPLFLPLWESGFGKLANELYPGVFNTTESTSLLDYYPYQGNFTPCYQGDEVVFTCTFYHYLLMGAPNVMILTDPAGKEKTLTVPFTVPEPVDGIIVVNIEPSVTTPTPTPTPEVSIASGSYRTLAVETQDPDDHFYGGSANIGYAIDKAFESATLTLNSDGSFSGSGSWSEPYIFTDSQSTARETSEMGIVHHEVSQNYNEDLEAIISFEGKIGAEEDGTWSYSVTVRQKGQTTNITKEPSGYGYYLSTTTQVNEWDYVITVEGTGTAAWFNEKRPESDTEEKCIMLYGGTEGRKTGHRYSKTDQVFSTTIDYDLPDDFHLENREPVDEEIYYDPYYMFFP